MATGIQVYEALQPLVGEDVARQLGGMADQMAQLITEQVFRAEMRSLESQISELGHKVDLRFAEAKAETREWMLKFFVPLWIGVYGTIAAVALDIIFRH